MDSAGPGSRFTLDDQLCFALHAASRAMTGCYRPLLEPLGLTYSQYAVLLVLWEGGAVAQGELCGRLYLDSGTLSPLLRRLESHGLITRRRRREDERTIEVGLTADGMALRERAVLAQARAEEATGLTAEELGGLRDDLHRLSARLRAADGGTEAERDAG